MSLPFRFVFVGAFLVIGAGCGRTAFDDGGGASTNPARDAATDARDIFKDSAADKPLLVADGAHQPAPDLAVERSGDGFRGDTAEVGTFGQFNADAGSVATNVGINAAHDNAQPDDEVQSPLTKRWTAHFGSLVKQPLVADGRVFVSVVESPPNVRALDLQTGATLWGPVATTDWVGMACDAVNVYTLEKGGTLSALDVRDGHTNWSTELTLQYGYPTPPIIAGGMLFVIGEGNGGTTYAIDAATGKTRWTAQTIAGSDGAVAVFGNTVYEAEVCHRVSAFDVVTGARRWLHPQGCSGGGGSMPMVSAGRIWVRDWLDGNIILDLNGKNIGTFSADTPPSFHNGLVFYLNGSTLTAVDSDTNASRWSFSGDNRLCTSATIAGRGRQIFVGSAIGKLYELDEDTGMTRSTDTVGLSVSRTSETQGVALAQNRLVVPAGNDLVVY